MEWSKKETSTLEEGVRYLVSGGERVHFAKWNGREFLDLSSGDQYGFHSLIDEASRYIMKIEKPNGTQ